jgi:hypothetical protein
MPRVLSKDNVLAAFAALDARLERPLTLIVGGGYAMVLAHGLTVATADVDAYPAGRDFEEVDRLVKEVAVEQGLPHDWLNPYYSTFAHVLPSDYAKRLVPVFSGKQLSARALGVEDLLVMKCFAGRAKDKVHARALLRLSPDLSLVNRRLDELMDRRVPGAPQAADFFDDLLSEVE